jgi:cellobiose-specific phosphotransferase system component IIC
MKWKTILLLSLFAILMGFISIFGIIQNLEWLLWLLIAIVSGYVLAQKTRNLLFTHAVSTGIIMGIFNAIVQSALFDTYLLNNPQIEGLSQWPTAIEPQYFILIAGPFIGIVYGLVIGLFALITKKVLKKN